MVPGAVGHNNPEDHVASIKMPVSEAADKKAR
jgi:hypothetical protein